MNGFFVQVAKCEVSRSAFAAAFPTDYRPIFILDLFCFQIITDVDFEFYSVGVVACGDESPLSCLASLLQMF